MNKNNDHIVGMCSVCGEVHVNQDGYDSDRGCHNCGEWSVYSIVEYRDIVNDWKKLKQDYAELMVDMDG